jgi:hypothetical protein
LSQDSAYEPAPRPRFDAVYLHRAGIVGGCGKLANQGRFG